jgi:hypothetical protein
MTYPWTHDAVRTDPGDLMTPFEQDEAEEREQFKNCMEEIANEASADEPDVDQIVYHLVMSVPGSAEKTNSQIERIKAILEEK